MISTEGTVQNSNSRPWLALALITIVPLLLGTTLAPHALRFLIWLGSYVDLGRHFSNPPLRRVVSRLVMLFAIVLIYPSFRLAGIRSFADLGWRPLTPRFRVMADGFMLGVLSMGAAYLLSALWGALYLRPRSTDLWVMTRKWTGLFVAAWIIGCFEETLFRGFVYRLLRKRWSVWFAVSSAALFFSAVHFLRPVEPAGLDPLRWTAGFQLLPHLTEGVQRQYAVPMFVNLLLMGVVLCLWFEAERHVYTIAGMHAGWVWMQGVGTFLFDRTPEKEVGSLRCLAFGNSETISMTWLGTSILALFFIAAIWKLATQRAGNMHHGTT